MWETRTKEKFTQTWGAGSLLSLVFKEMSVPGSRQNCGHGGNPLLLVRLERNIITAMSHCSFPLVAGQHSEL